MVIRMSTDARLILVLANELLEKAKKEAEEIIEEAKVKSMQIIENAERKAEALKDERLEKLMAKIRKELYKEYALIKLDLRRHFTVEKNKVIQDLLDSAVKKVLEIVEKSDSIYIDSLKKLGIEAILNLYSEDIVLYCCNERDRDFLRSFVDDIINEVSKRGKKVKVTIAEELVRCKGGVLAMSADGREYYNNTLEARVKRLKEEILPEILSNLLEKE